MLKILLGVALGLCSSPMKVLVKSPPMLFVPLLTLLQKRRERTTNRLRMWWKKKFWGGEMKVHIQWDTSSNTSGKSDNESILPQLERKRKSTGASAWRGIYESQLPNKIEEIHMYIFPHTNIVFPGTWLP